MRFKVGDIVVWRHYVVVGRVVEVAGTCVVVTWLPEQRAAPGVVAACRALGIGGVEKQDLANIYCDFAKLRLYCSAI